MKLPIKTEVKLYNRQHGRCYYCGEQLGSWEIDHILPFSKYKNGEVENLCLTCFECNHLKSKKELDEFKIFIEKNYPHKLIRGLFYFQFLEI